MADYEKPDLPPATPPTVDPKANPVSARELADDEGDSDADVHDEASQKREGGEDALAKDRHDKKLAERDKMDGAGEQALDSMKPETLLPPD
jgi:hypothetical protein